MTENNVPPSNTSNRAQGVHTEQLTQQNAQIENIWFHPDPRVRIAWTLKGFFIALFFMAIFSGWMMPILADKIVEYIGRECFLMVGIALLIPLVIAIVWASLFYDRYTFMVNHEGIHINRGILWKRSVIIPYERVQHVTITRGPLEILLGIASLNIFTAGTASIGGGFGPAMNMMAAEGSIPGLRNPELFREYIMGHVEKTRGSGLGDEKPPTLRTGLRETGVPSGSGTSTPPASGGADITSGDVGEEILEELRRIRKLLEECNK